MPREDKRNDFRGSSLFNYSSVMEKVSDNAGTRNFGQTKDVLPNLRDLKEVTFIASYSIS
jgi:hypothetical protein